MNDASVYDRVCNIFFTDSIALAYEACDIGALENGCTKARYSAISAMLLLEAASNACLDSLSLPRALHDEIDKLTILSKFDLYARLSAQVSIDRSRSEVQGMEEIRRLRNDYVHSKAKKIGWTTKDFIVYEGVSPKTRHLDLPKIFSYFEPKDALVVLRRAHLFLAYLFRQVCRMDPSAVSSVLFSISKVPCASDEGFCPEIFGHYVTWLSENNIDINYMKVRNMG